MSAARSGRVSVLFAALAVIVLAGAAAGWACTGQGTISLNPSAGPSGTSVRIEGTGLGQNPVDIRWGSSGGPILATAASGNFAARVTIPETGAGVHYIVAVPRDDEERSRAPAPAAFRVTAPAPAASQEPAPAASPQPQPQPQPTATPTPAQSGPTSAPAPTPAPAPRPAPRAAAPRRAAPATAVAPAPAPVAAVPVPTATPSPAPVPVPVPAPVPEPELAPATPSPASVTADLWRGFRPSASPSAGPSLADPAVPASSGSGSGFAFGVVLLSIGLVTLFGGAVAAVALRRRAPAESPGPQ